MGLRYEWDDDSHVTMNLYMEAPWTWEEFQEVSRTVYGMIGKLNHPCATVVNIEKMGQIPKGNVLAHLQQLDRIIPPNVVVSVMVGVPYAATVFMSMLNKIRPSTQRITAFVRTTEEARELVQKRLSEHETISNRGKLR